MSDRTPHLFSKRHYVWLASVMRDIRHKLGNRTVADIATSVLADALAYNSPGFDRQRFMDAVQWNPDKATQPRNMHKGRLAQRRTTLLRPSNIPDDQ
jgi:hypothetical protein